MATAMTTSTTTMAAAATMHASGWQWGAAVAAGAVDCRALSFAAPRVSRACVYVFQITYVNNTIILEYNLGGKWIVQSSYVCN
jgi:hypothetical protein